MAAIAAVLILLLATVALSKVVVASTPDIKIPGVGSLRDKVQAAFNAAISGLTSALDALLHGASKLFHWTVKLGGWFGRSIGNVFGDIYDALDWFVATYVPREIGKAYHYTETKVATLASKVAHDLSVAERYTVTEIDKLAKTVAHDLSVAEKYTVTKVDAFDAKIASDLKAAESYALSEALKAETAAKAAATAALGLATTALNDAISGVSAALTAAESTLTADYTAIKNEVDAITSTSIPAVVAAIDADIEGAATDVWVGVSGAVTGAIGVAGEGFADVRGWLGSIPLSGITDLASLGVITAAIAGTVAKLAEDCVMPQCQNLGGLSSLIGDLTGLLETGALLLFLEELANDPAAFAQDCDDILGPIANASIDTIRGLLSV